MTYLFIALAIAIILLAAAAAGKKTTNSSEFFSQKPLSEAEQVAYWRLKEACGEDKVVMPQVAFSSFIRTKGGNKKERASNFARARQKVADFVICNKDFSIYGIVEIDDKTHKAEKDALRDKITEAAGIKTFRVTANKLPTAIEFREVIGL